MKNERFSEVAFHLYMRMITNAHDVTRKGEKKFFYVREGGGGGVENESLLELLVRMEIFTQTLSLVFLSPRHSHSHSII